VQDEIIEAVESGTPYTAAAQYAGVSRHSLLNWRKWGAAEQERIDLAWEVYEDLRERAKAPDSDITDEQLQQAKDACKPLKAKRKYLNFFNKIEEAAGIAAVGWVRVIDDRARIDPSWAAWMLRMRYPQDFGERINLTSPPDEPVQIDTRVEVEADVKVAQDVTFQPDGLAEILSVLAEVGAIPADALQAPDGSPDTPDDEVHPGNADA
jgi:hypothetical protein